MEVYLPVPVLGFELCQPLEKDGYETFSLQINGTRRQQEWRPIAVRLVHDNNGEPLAFSESPWLSTHALTFRPLAVEALGPLLRENGELLPLAGEDFELSVFNPTRVIDALDEQASSIARFSSGRMMRIRRYAFKPELIEGIDVFKLPNLRVSPTLLSERFVRAWNATGFHGLEFEKVWST